MRFHLLQLEGCLFGSAGAEQGGVSLGALAAAEEPARRLGDEEAAEDEEKPGGHGHPEDLRQASF